MSPSDSIEKTGTQAHCMREPKDSSTYSGSLMEGDEEAKV